MKQLSLRGVQQKYNQKLRTAKESYKKENNLKVARGFKNTDAFKDLAKSKKQAVERKLKQISLAASTVVFDQTSASNQKLNSPQRAKIAKQQKISPFTYLAYHEIFYLVLSYGSGSGIKLIQDAKEKLENQKKKVTVTVFFTDGTTATTTSNAVFLVNIERLYNQLIEEEDLTGKYPLVDIASFGIDAQNSAISVRPVKETDWLEKRKK